MVLQVISVILILAGGVFMTLSILKYLKLTKTSGYTRNTNSKFITITILFIMMFFVGGYGVGAIHIITDDVEPIYYFIGAVFFVGGAFVFILMTHMLQMNNALNEKNSQIAKHNIDLQMEINDNIKDYVHQDELLKTVNNVASTLLVSAPEDFDENLLKSMGELAECVDVDRVYIWKNSVENGELYCTQIYEWSEFVDPQQGNDLTVHIRYEDAIPTWEAVLSKGESINSIVKDMAPEEKAHLEAQDIVSILVVPIMYEDVFWGFMGFDDCYNKRTFSEVEEGILRSASLMITVVMLRNETMANLIKAREEAEISTKAKSTFLSNMSHEIRTPINAITGMTAIAKKSSDINRIRDCLDKVEAASRQLLAIINDILDMSKIEAGKMELLSEPFDLQKTIANIRSIIGVRVDEKHQQFTVEISQDIPRIVIGDEMRLSQIFINLLSNAVKFTPEHGKIKFTINVLDRKDDVYQFEVQVEDTGIGMSESQQAKLFQAFEQAEKNTSHKYGGTGLGLAISQQIAKMMDGKITAESQEGVGSRFTLVFKLSAGSERMMEDIESGHDMQNLDLQNCRALLAEDIKINQEIVLSLLEDTGMTVDCADNGAIALEMFTRAPELYDIIFMDVYMPEMDGYEATRRIRSTDHPHAETIPIIAMTANAFAEDINNCLAAGMNDHIAKPIDVEKLYEAIEKYLKK